MFCIVRTTIIVGQVPLEPNNSIMLNNVRTIIIIIGVITTFTTINIYIIIASTIIRMLDLLIFLCWETKTEVKALSLFVYLYQLFVATFSPLQQ